MALVKNHLINVQKQVSKSVSRVSRIQGIQNSIKTLSSDQQKKYIPMIDAEDNVINPNSYSGV